MQEYTSLETSRKLFEMFGWMYSDNHRYIEKVWMRRYSIWEMGEGNDDYDSTPPEERRAVRVDEEWSVTDNPRGRMTTGQEVFKWWYSDVRKLEEESIPAYTLTYLLDKLPIVTEELGRAYPLAPSITNNDSAWVACYRHLMTGPDSDRTYYEQFADTPVEAAALLCLELGKQGILPGKDTNE